MERRTSLAKERGNLGPALLSLCLTHACGINSDEGTLGSKELDGGHSGYTPGADGGTNLDGGLLASACDPELDDLTLPEGFCALVYARDLGAARHMAVTPSGDVFVAVADSGESKGGIVALRDEDGDGVSDTARRFGPGGGGNGIAWQDGKLYFAQDHRILRYDLEDGKLEPSGELLILVDGLPSDGDHPAKTVVPNGDRLFVNFGSASNSCQEDNRKKESPGKDPCPELDVRAGVWEFDAKKPGQEEEDGTHFATGSRNLNALALQPDTHALYGAQNGRDQLHENWPSLFSADDDARLPAEVLLKIERNDDFGWPYCYYDAALKENVLAPEYGGDGKKVGRCTSAKTPEASYPAHWAPLGAVFYEGTSFPAHYRHGLFIANHGSRFAPNAKGDPPGYNVIFQPFAEHAAEGKYEEFATGFAGDARPLPDEAKHRPVGVAVAPDGSLFISDDMGGRVWRVIYLSGGETQPDGGLTDAGADASSGSTESDAGASDGGAGDGSVSASGS
jgi:glucose/arabinose dehydrogenase